MLVVPTLMKAHTSRLKLLVANMRKQVMTLTSVKRTLFRSANNVITPCYRDSLTYFSNVIR
jgi:hypothetical protein